MGLGQDKYLVVNGDKGASYIGFNDIAYSGSAGTCYATSAGTFYGGLHILDGNLSIVMPKQQYHILPERVIFQDEKKTVVVKGNNQTTIVHATEEDEYDRVYGFLMAYFINTSGMTKNKAHEYLQNLKDAPSQTKGK